MSNDEIDLERRLEEGMDEIRSALDTADGDGLPDEAAESVRESADAVAEGVSDASLGDLLTASGFEDESDDVTPADLPVLMQDADPDSVLSLRHLLEVADLSDEWSNLDDEDRLERLERIGEDEATGDGGRSVSDLLSSVFSMRGSDEAKNEDDAAENEDEATSDGEESDESEVLSAEDAVDEFNSLFERLGEGEDGEEAKDDDDGDEEDEEDEKSDAGSGGSGRGRATDMYSTMPSSRSDMDGRKRHSTVRGKN